MTVDPDEAQEIRMRAGAQTLVLHEAMDEVAIESMREAGQAVAKFVDLMLARGVPGTMILGMVLGMGTDELVDDWRDNP